MSRFTEEYDFVVIGSGASGATAALKLSEAGYQVAVLEEGGTYRREDFKPDLYFATAKLFRNFGLQAARAGLAVLPVLEGRCVGGSTVINGAISHRLPESVWAEWVKKESLLQETLPYSSVDASASLLEKDLSLKSNLALSGLPVHATLNRLAWAHEAMVRNAPGCQSSGRCLQGCPSGGKLSMERSFLPRAIERGTKIFDSHRVEAILFERQRAIGVRATHSGSTRNFRAKKAVILAAGVTQSPIILGKSGLRNPLIGKNFQCHLSVAVTGIFSRPRTEIEGPPQGIEITHFQKEKIKLATQLLPPELLFSRSPLVGSALVEALKNHRNCSSWMASIRSEAVGTVRGRKISFRPTAADLLRCRRALHELCLLLFELGAKRVYPGLSGSDSMPLELTEPADAKKILSVPLDSRYFWISLGHLFGTNRLSTDLRTGVVNPMFQVYGTQNLLVLDASVFPSNIGVNPQFAVMSVAHHACNRLLASS